MSLLFDTPQMHMQTQTAAPHSAPPAVDARHAAEAEDAKAERRLKDAVRRYYALAELVETERGYVEDLRILVEVYLASLGAVPAPSVEPRAEALISEISGTGSAISPASASASAYASSSSASTSGPSYFRTHRESAYQYPPSAFPSSSALLKEEVEVEKKGIGKGKARKRPASVQVLSAMQHGELDKEVKVRVAAGDASPSGSGSGMHARSRSSGFGFGSSSGKGVGGGRRSSTDYVRPMYAHTYTNSPDTSPHPSPSQSPCALPSIPSSPLSTGPPSPLPLPIPSHGSHRQQRRRLALTNAERRILARGARDILSLHERIVGRVEDALAVVQREVAERKRAAKGKERSKRGERAEREREEVEGEIEAAVRAICGVFVAEASNFTPYEDFCAGHTEALDTARRATRVHAGEWGEWEKRCAEAAGRVGECGDYVYVKVEEDEVEVEGEGEGEVEVEMEQLPSPVARRASRGSLLSGVAADGDDARSSTSTLRRRHSAYPSTEGLRASASAALKHTKSDPTPPAGHAHSHSQSYGLGSAYSTLSVKRLSRAPEGQHNQDAMEKEKEHQRERERNARMKLAFSDYLIKPVQRVCKYPLLFESLRVPGRRMEGEEDAAKAPTPTAASTLDTGDFFSIVTAAAAAAASAVRTPEAGSGSAVAAEVHMKKKRNQAAFSLGGDSDEEDEEFADAAEEIDFDADETDTEASVGRALKKMREIAKAVDEAQRRRELENKSTLIVERLAAGAPSGGSPGPRSASIPDASVQEDEKNSAEDGRVDSYSELGHGPTTTYSTKPPVRSLSFSSAFTRSRTRSTLGRTSSSFLHQQQQQQVSDAGELLGRMQVPGPPTRAFLSSLGACLLAGSLDVVVGNIERSASNPTRREGSRRESMLSLTGISMSANVGFAAAPTFVPPPSRDPVKVKYLAAFLYVGGYVILAKTAKAGVYEPRHWFALTDETIEIVDVREEKALLPCSFHLVFHATGHRLELAAACQREKELWLNAIRHARSLPPMWDFEPVPTLNISATLVNAQQPRASVDVPPVPSIPAVGDEHLSHEINPSRMPSNATLKSETTIKPNRRQSGNASSMRAFFMHGSDNAVPASSTVLIRRVSASRRAQTDRHLADVLSQPLISARFFAKTHDEVLFRDPDPPHQGNGIGVGAMAKNRLMARESVLVSKQCAPSVCSSIASSVDQRSVTSDSGSSVTLQQQSQPVPRGKAAKKGLNRSSLSMLLTLPSALSEGNTRDSRTSTSSSQGPLSPDSPLPSTSTTQSSDPLERSQCSSITNSVPTSSPVNELFPPEVRVVGVDSRAENEEMLDVLEHMERPKRSRSLVDNFRGFFGTPRSLSSSPAPSMSSSRQASVEGSLEVPDANEETERQGNVISRILTSTLSRARGRSVSDNINDMQAISSSNQVSASQTGPSRPSFLSRSSSMLVAPRHKMGSSSADSTRSQISPHLRTSPSSARMSLSTTRTSISQTQTYARNQHSLGRAIKYRLFPGSLVPLTPIDRSRDRRS